MTKNVNPRIVGAVFRREFSSYFATPIALIFLTFFLVINGFFTFKLGGFYELGQADLRPFFVWHPWLPTLVSYSAFFRSITITPAKIA